jgi:hypothetical protein
MVSFVCLVNVAHVCHGHSLAEPCTVVVCVVSESCFVELIYRLFTAITV